MHTFNELDLWNRRHEELVREMEGERLMRSLRLARRATMEKSAQPLERIASIRWRFWIRGHGTA